MNRKRAGFTLVEVLVATVCTAILMAGLATMFNTLLQHGVQGTQRSIQQQDARWVVGMIAQDVKYATKVTSTAGTSGVLSFEKNDINHGLIKVRYDIRTDANGFQVLTRTAVVPLAAGGTETVVNPICDPRVNYATAGDFTATVEASSSVVNFVTLKYISRKDAADPAPVVVQTSVFPLNNPALSP